MKFESEKELFNTALKCPNFINYFSDCPTKFLVEPKGLFGIPDLVLVNVDSIYSPSKLLYAAAFEMKLSNWKRALMQAYRYRSFAEISYVMLDKAYIKPALRNLEAFKKANVGLLSINRDGNLIKHYHPRMHTPYCENLRGNLENLALTYSQPHGPQLTGYQCH